MIQLVILSLSLCGNKPVGGIGEGLPSTARALILSLLATILQSISQFIPPLALDALWQLTQFACINDRTALNKGPAAAFVIVILAAPVQPVTFFAVTVYDPAVNPLKSPLAWKWTPSMLYENPVLPLAVAEIVPLAAWHGVAEVEVPVTVITTPVQALGELIVNCFEPVQPFEFLATIVYTPADKFTNVPDD